MERAAMAVVTSRASLPADTGKRPEKSVELLDLPVDGAISV
jgi:hypothetical protein